MSSAYPPSVKRVTLKDIYQITRPSWAKPEKWETGLIFLVSLAVGLYGAYGQTIASYVLSPFPSVLKHVPGVWPLVDLIVVTAGGMLIVKVYKHWRVRHYPCTFLYCFYMPEASNPDGHSRVVGYCTLTPDYDDGELLATGASYPWENGQVLDDIAGFTSTSVRPEKGSEHIFCHINFDLDRAARVKRFYHHGVLSFELLHAVGLPGGEYAGHLRSTNKPGELSDVDVYANGYAQWFAKGIIKEADIRRALTEQGSALFARLDTLLKTDPHPFLWECLKRSGTSHPNFWSHPIPLPQTVILHPELGPFVLQWLSRVLSILGLQSSEANRFCKTATAKARAEDSDSLAYERALKQALTGMVKKAKEDAALMDRARIIFEQISPFLIGESLLDIGCGNGLVSYLAKDRFKQIMLLDVVRYVPPAFGLNFLEYRDGEPLPVKQQYDTVLLLTVLHHAEDPLRLLREAWATTRQRLVIIESVVGVHALPNNVKYELVNRSDEDQIAFAAFVDWFYNRVLHDDVPVPYNFTKPDNWKARFVQYGMHLTQTVELGQDIEIGPEYHVLFVLDKQGEGSDSKGAVRDGSRAR